MKERDSNFELCRLVCMFYIVFYHLIIHVPGLYEAMPWARPLRTIFHIGVVVFVMISGYYGIRRSWKGVLKLILMVAFYNLLGLLAAHFLYSQPFESSQLLRIVLPISHGGYWFITSYVILYLIAPYVNIVLQGLSKKEYWIYLGILALLVCYLGGIHDVKACDGRGILAFVLSYSIGFFIHRFYPPGVKFPVAGNHPFALYVAVCIVIYLLVAFAPEKVSKGVNYLSFGYNEIGLYIMSVLLFLSFQKMRIRSRIINYAALSTLAIYLIHENKFINELVVYRNYETLSNWFGGGAWGQLVFHLLFCLAVTIACIAIDQIRLLFFKAVKLR